MGGSRGPASLTGMAVAGCVLVAGLVTWGSSLLVTSLATAGSLPHVVVPGSADVVLDAGRYGVYSEAPTGTDEAMSDPSAVPGFDCRLTAPSGASVPVGPYAGKRGYTVGDYTGTARYTFSAPVAGRYHLLCYYDGADGASIVLAIRRAGPPWQSILLPLAIVAAVAGVVAALLVAGRGRRGVAVAPIVTIAAIVAVAVSAPVVVVTGVAVLIPARGQGTVLVAGDPEQPAAPGMGTTSPDPVPFTQIRSGDCLNRPLGTTRIDSVPRVPCTHPHDEEVYAIVDLGDGPWPGEDAVDARALQLCSVAAEPFLGISAEDTLLDLRRYQPIEISWEYGENTVLCRVADPLGKTTGTLRGSRR